jgi:C4-dicarboxylate-specific signal transduction histidine kinase
MSIMVQGERVEEEQNAALALLEAKDREEFARALLRIALQRSRASIVGGLEVLAEGARANLSFIRIDGVILEVLGMFRDELKKSSISVRADIDEGLPELRGDREQLQQVVFKLLRNGIDAMKDVHGRPRRLEISCRADDIEMIMAFRYCGGGLGTNTNDMNRLTRLFDPIVTTRDSGMSLGLFISRRIIEAHRGRIWAERNEDCGLTIRLALPL